MVGKQGHRIMIGRIYSSEAQIGSPLRNLVIVLSFVFTVGFTAVLGYRAAGWSWSDAVYMVTLTLYTVGYSEVRPINTAYLHFVTMATIILGCTGMIVLTGVLVQFFTVGQLKQLLGIGKMQKQLEKLDQHAIICGYGRIGMMLARDLQTANFPLVIVDRNPAKLREAEAKGFFTLAGDASEEAVLEAAGLARACVITTVLPDDAANVFITLTARSLNRSIKIIARGEAPATEKKLLHAGADQVVLPTHIGAERIAEMILFPDTADFIRETEGIGDLKRGMSEFGLEIEVVKAVPDGAMTGLSVLEAERAGCGGFFVIQLNKREGQSIRHPSADIIIDPNDIVVLVVRAGRVSSGSKFSQPKGPIRVGRSRM